MDIAVLVVAFLMGLAIAWINFSGMVSNYAAGVGLTLLVAFLGLAVLKALVPDLDANPGEHLPTGGRTDWMLGEWTSAAVELIASHSPGSFWAGLIGGLASFYLLKKRVSG